jgi:hypothetical protein
MVNVLNGAIRPSYFLYSVLFAINKLILEHGSIVYYFSDTRLTLPVVKSFEEAGMAAIELLVLAYEPFQVLFLQLAPTAQNTIMSVDILLEWCDWNVLQR